MTRTFISHNIPQIEQINSTNGRRYRTPDGNLYPSVTTVLSTMSAKYLAEWRLKVGEEAAEKISSAAARRGTLIHEAAERYIKNKEVEFQSFQHSEKEMFENLIPYLNKFEEIHALETRMWSDKLRVAGTVDCVAKVNGKLYVIDFKTSGRFKSATDIESYYLQVAAYSVMFWERTGIVIPDTKILITTQDDGVLEYNNTVKPWIPKFIKLRNNIN